MTIDLLREPQAGGFFVEGRRAPTLPMVVTRARPFVRSLNRRGAYVHRVRSALTYWRLDETGARRFSHAYFHTWCGMGLQARRAETFDAVPTGPSPLCATCEGRAVGIGLPSATFACEPQHPTRFAPVP